MIALAVDLIGGFGFVLLLVAVHEYGHYAGGRMLGVPADSIRVELTGNPPHVALRDDERAPGTPALCRAGTGPPSPKAAAATG